MILTLALTSLRRIVRDRTAMFFVVALPVLIILVIGTVTRSFEGFRVAVVDQDQSQLSARLVNALVRDDDLDVELVQDLDAVRTDLRRTEVHAVVVIPAGYEMRLAQEGAASVEVLGERTNESQRAARATVEPVVVAEGAKVQAAIFAGSALGANLDERLDAVDEIAEGVPSAAVDRVVVDAESESLPAGFSYSAPTMLVLFVFVNCLAAAGTIIQTRRLRLYERMTAAPVRAGAIVAGETLATFGLAMLQSALVVVVGAVFFGVDWGDPLGAMALVVTWGLVGTGAGVLAGTLFTTPEQAGSIGPAIGIAFGMLGGCMWPLEIVPPVMRTIGHVVPHGWAIDAWTQLIAEGAGISGIGGELLVLAAFAAVLLGAATLRLRAALAG